MNNRYRNLRIALAIQLCLVFGPGCGESSQPVAVSPQEDAFLSYWQCADSLAKRLLEITSHAELIATREAIGPANPTTTQPMKDILDDLCAKLETYKSGAEQVSATMTELLLLQHEELVNAVQAAVTQLADRHAKSPEILGEDWNRYRPAFAIRGLIREP